NASAPQARRHRSRIVVVLLRATAAAGGWYGRDRAQSSAAPASGVYSIPVIPGEEAGGVSTDRRAAQRPRRRGRRRVPLPERMNALPAHEQDSFCKELA